MKNTLLMALAIMAAGTVSAQKTDWANFSRYEQSNTEIAAAPAQVRRVVFFGNSITDAWPSVRPQFFSGNGFVGRGISGQTTYQFLSRFRDDVINLHPEYVVINAATNDIAENTHPYNADRTFGNIVSMVELAKANGIEPVLTTTLPAAAFYWNPEIKDAPEKIAALNARLAEYARTNGIPFVDYHSALLGADGRGLDPRFSEDGVHPNADGYSVMEKLILPYIGGDATDGTN
ncbi:MAG: SGNH/GDSL hydrolase family protein [Muribaculaceae bacterium]|nr:SGNH/GDSL hydrolase family protein [Muribaculaceae bacterium]